MPMLRLLCCDVENSEQKQMIVFVVARVFLFKNQVSGFGNKN